MKKMPAVLVSTLPAMLLLGACASTPLPPAPLAAVPGETVELIPFQIGVSTFTVERLARARTCTGGKGAGLITEPGPVEVYRMRCEDGRVFMAMCTLRQCRPMP